jgi:aconitate hydratase
VCAAVLSGNRNFEARIHPNLKANFLASPPLVVAYAIAGTVRVDLMTEPVGQGKGGKDVYLGDIWPTSDEMQKLLKYAMKGKAFRENYAKIATEPGKLWKARASGQVYTWPRAPTSPSRRSSPTSRAGAQTGAGGRRSCRAGARIMALFGDSITTDHISPAGSIKDSSPPGSGCCSMACQSRLQQLRRAAATTR